MLTQHVNRIFDEFLREAKNSPRLFKDMAAMETYLAESYGDRILIELLQNADDAQSQRTLLKVVGHTVFFANDGRPFSKSDLVAICRSGSSEKKRGKEIGYRGVGFKSTTSMSKDIIISSSGAIFAFSKKRCASVLGVREADVPTVRIPFLVDDSEIDNKVLNEIQTLHQNGYNSIFVFENSFTSIIEEEMKSFDISCLMFLRNIEELIFPAGEVISAQRNKSIAGIRIYLSSSAKNESWFLPQVHSESTCAFKIDENEQVVGCNSNEAVFHCYMPTLDPSPYKIKINGDFSTDPSRKHLTIDENTKAILNLISFDLLSIVQKCFDGVIHYDGILNLLANRISYATAATDLHDRFVNNIYKNINILLNNGQITSIENYKLHDEFLSPSERQFVSQNSKIFNGHTAINNSVYIEEFIYRFSKTKYFVSDYFKLLTDMSFVEKCDVWLLAKIYAYVIKKMKTEALIEGDSTDCTACLLITDNRILHAKEFSGRLDKDFRKSLKSYVTEDEWEWFSKNAGISFDLFAEENEKNAKIKPVKSQAIVSKWRSAEQQCVDIEESFGNKAVHVGNKNLGYDVESITPKGEYRYIEVKLLSSDKGSFTMTNNEYSAAHQYGNDYFMCIIIQNETMLKVTYIQNPLEKLLLEKRVRQWEWYCEAFTGDEYIFSYQGS